MPSAFIRATAVPTGLAAIGAVCACTGPGDGDTSVSAASTAGVQCSYSHSAYNASPSVQATSTSIWQCTASERRLSANGIPDHDAGTFPNAGNPHAIAAQAVSATMTLTPSLASSTGSPVVVAGYALNGVKLDPATAGTCVVSGISVSCSAIGGAGPWHIEALGQSRFNYGIDANHAHVQPGGAYHYHGVPEGFVAQLGKGQAMTLVGFAVDGFPVYARYGYTNADDAHSAVKVLASSYRLKTNPDAGRPAITDYPMGSFTQDYVYASGAGDLDECNGRTGVTPEFPRGIYHYVITNAYPFIQRCIKGTPAN